jgi:hypothetical protein
MKNKFILISFCNNPAFSASPILCAKIPLDWREPISCAPVALGFPEPIAQVTGLTKTKDRIFVVFANQEGRQYLAVLQQSDLTPLFYQELPGIVDCHSILAIKNQLYVVSTGTDQILCYEILNDSVSASKVFWQASNSQQDTHHINSIIEKDGDVLVSAFGTKTGQLWSTATGGYIHNITKNVRVKEGVYHPHSLSVRNEKIYYSDSQKNAFCSNEDDDPLFSLNGYTRGAVWLSNEVVCIASSIGRRVSKSTGLISNSADPGIPAGECNLIVGSITSKEIIAQIDLSWFGPEIYDLLIIEGDLDLLVTMTSAHLSERKLVQTLNTELQTLNTQAFATQHAMRNLEQAYQITEFALNQILQSKSWKFIQVLQLIRLRLVPIGSRRERWLQLVWHGFRLLRSQGVAVILSKALAHLFGKSSWYNRLQIARRASLRKPDRRYRPVPGVKETGFFDFEWYLNDNPEVLDAGINPIEHYLTNGIRDERNPNPLFNTSIYARSAGLEKEDAFLHFVGSNRLFAPGAYRNAEVLITAQKKYQKDLRMECIKDHRSQSRKYAVYFQCGAGSIHEKWLKDSGRDWDLLVNHYDQTHLNKISCDVEFTQTGTQPGTKFTSFNQLQSNGTKLLESYRYVLLLDDDILMSEEDINLLFKIADEKGLDIAQASLSPDSYCAHPVFKNPGTGGIRYVNAVEIMMPVISQSVIKRGGYLFDQTISGWGLDVALGQFANQIAVVDDVVARHMKPINVDEGAFYKMLHRAFIYPEIELTHIQRIYGVGRSFYSVATPGK